MFMAVYRLLLKTKREKTCHRKWIFSTSHRTTKLGKNIWQKVSNVDNHLDDSRFSPTHSRSHMIRVTMHRTTAITLNGQVWTNDQSALVCCYRFFFLKFLNCVLSWHFSSKKIGKCLHQDSKWGSWDCLSNKLTTTIQNQVIVGIV